MTELVNKIIQGDALEVLKQMPDDLVNTIITSPPYYQLRRYQAEKQIGLENSVEEYIENLLKIIHELKRVLKSTGSFWLNLGDSFGGSLQGHGAKKKSPHGIQSPPAIDGFHPGKTALHKLNPKSMLMIPERIAIKMLEHGWKLRNKIIYCKVILNTKTNKTMGSCMPTSSKDRFMESSEFLYFFTKSKKYWSDIDSIRIPTQVLGVTDFRKNRGGYVDPNELYDNGKYSKFDGIKKLYKERKIDKTAEHFKLRGSGGNINLPSYNNQRKNIPSAWLVFPEPHRFEKEFGIEHYASFPEELVRRPIIFTCHRDGIVLDPFCGSGTTLLVAKKLGRNYIGIDISKDYCELSKRRLNSILI